MKQFIVRAVLLAGMALGLAQSAQAHVSYTDINDVITLGGYQSFTNYGWQQGTTFPYATTDDVNFYNFHLNQASFVSLSLTSTDIGDPVNAPALVAPAFSLYSGVFVAESFDTNPIYPLAQGQRGLVNTLGSFSLTTQPQDGDPVANERTVHFITSATDGGTGTAQINQFLLGPGDYTIIASGNSPYVPAQDGNAIYGATFAFATAVPEPGIVWMLLGGVLAGLRIRKQHKA